MGPGSKGSFPGSESVSEFALVVAATFIASAGVSEGADGVVWLLPQLVSALVELWDLRCF